MKFCYWFNELTSEDINIAGGKGANLGQMTQLGIPVPNGFVVASDAYAYFLRTTGIEHKIKQIVQALDVHKSKQLADASKSIKALILKAAMPEEIAAQIIISYQQLIKGNTTKVAVRSSATAEDLPQASFAGQQETYLNISGSEHVVHAVQKCWASLFEERALFYRAEQKFDQLAVSIAVPIQLMIEADRSGIMFTINPTTLDAEQIVIEAGYGLGAPIVSGEITPDQYTVEKSTGKTTHIAVNKQEWQLTQKGKVKIPGTKALQQKLTNTLIKELAHVGKTLENAYDAPQDIEWAVAKNKVFIVQTRPVTARERRAVQQIARGQKATALLNGIAASPGAGIGVVHIIKNKADIASVRPGEILVSAYTNPDFVPAMRKVAAIVTDQGGKTSHAAIVSRELGIPCVVGTQNATKLLKKGELITVDGNTGLIYKGALPLTAKKKIHAHVTTKTKIYVNLADPQTAPAVAALTPDGVGLLRNEFILSQIGKHPKQFIKEKKQEQLVKELVATVSVICSNFMGKPVVYRASDFKSNEYATLTGGKQFEPHEENPLLGYRGAARYIVDSEVFKLELEAIKCLRSKHKFTNLWLMIPFVRSPQELHEVKRIITKAGLKRSATFKLWMMVETPANVLCLEEYLKIGIDGISIGSNDLTMLTLGVDRDNARIAHLYNEADKAVLKLMLHAIAVCKKHHVTSSICGQLASNDMRVVELLVKAGITSLSVNTDALDQVREAVLKAEKKK